MFHTNKIYNLEIVCVVLIGLIYSNFLYYINTGFNYWVILLIIAAISLAFLAHNLKIKEIQGLLIVRLYFFYLYCSVIFGSFDFFVYGNKPVFNDFIRITLYTIYFSWTYLFVKKYKNLDAFIYISLGSLVLLFFGGFLQLRFPSVFLSLFNNEAFGVALERGIFRVSGFMFDSNVFAVSIIFHFLVLYYTVFISRYKFFGIVLLALVGVYVNLSGSRFGLIFYLLTFMVLGREVLSKKMLVNKTNTLITVFVVSLLMIVVVFFYYNSIENFLGKNDIQTASLRFFGQYSEEAQISSNLRYQSIYDAMKFSERYGYIFGPGMFNFSNAWDYPRFPHNGLIFLYSQYGIFILYIIFLFVKIFDKIKNSKLLLFYLILFLTIGSLVNIIYYANFYYCIIFFENHIYFKGLKANLKKDECQMAFTRFVKK